MWVLKEEENSLTLPASPPVPTSLTPSPSPRGEGSDMPCASTTCYWLTCQLVNWLTRQLPNHSSTSQTLVNSLTGQRVNSLACQPVNSLTG